MQVLNHDIIVDILIAYMQEYSDFDEVLKYLETLEMLKTAEYAYLKTLELETLISLAQDDQIAFVALLERIHKILGIEQASRESIKSAIWFAKNWTK